MITLSKPSPKMTVWALFDSGNGSYTKGVKRLNKNIEIYPIGIDIENKNNHFINLNLADYSRLFGDNALFDTLDKLPKPTRFSGNIELNLKNEKKSNDVEFQDWTKSYNERSNIPQSLVCEIFEKVYKEIENEEKTRQPANDSNDSTTGLTSH